MVLVDTSCLDEVILAEIFVLGSQFMTKFNQILKYFSTDLISLFLHFRFMVLYQDNHKLVEARFFLTSSWMAFKWISTSSCFRNSSGFVFLRSVHTYSWCLKSNWSCNFGHAETGNGAKRVVLRREIFCSIFK